MIIWGKVKGCLPQILLGPFLNTSPHLVVLNLLLLNENPFFRKFISNKAQGRTNKHTCAYQGVINVRFWKIWLALFSCFEIRSFVLLLTNYFMFNSKWEIFAYNLIIEESF